MPGIKIWDGSQWKDITYIYYRELLSWKHAKAAYYWDGSKWVRFWGPYEVIWHCDDDVDKVYELSTIGFGVIRSTYSPEDLPRGIGGDANTIWHCDDCDKVYELSTADFSVIRSASSPSTRPWGIGGK